MGAGGACYVLVTHEHPDHLDVEKLAAACARNPDLRVYLPPAALEQAPELGGAAITVEPGQRLTVAGFTLDVVGGQHAETYDGLPGCANVGFVVDGDVYHPGDSLFVPPLPVSTLLVPAAAPGSSSPRRWTSCARSSPCGRSRSTTRPSTSSGGSTSTRGWTSRETEYARPRVGDPVTL
ncbi:MBL fold metallo-hydrolase [Kitasatospora aburaviensis]